MKDKIDYAGGTMIVFLVMGAMIYSMRSMDGRTVAVVLQGFCSGLSRNDGVYMSLMTLGRWLWLILVPIATYGYILYLYRINIGLTIQRYGSFRRWYLEIFEMMILVFVLFAMIMILWSGRRITDLKVWKSVVLLTLHLMMLSSIITWITVYCSNTAGIVVAIAGMEITLIQLTINHQLSVVWLPWMWSMYQQSDLNIENGFDVSRVIWIQLTIILLSFVGCAYSQKHYGISKLDG